MLKSCLFAHAGSLLRGIAIAKHSQVITAVCNRLGIERTTRQNLIRTARDNGKRLGLLA
jgi:hypothetical protein